MKDAERIAELEAAQRRSELLIEQLQAQLNLRRRKRERLAGCSADKLAALSPAEQPVADEREAFEQAFPLPEGIVWSGKSYGPSFPNASPSVFVGLCGIAARQDALFSAWQARAALSPAEQPGRAVLDALDDQEPRP